MEGKVLAICICPVAGRKMMGVSEVEAIAGQGFKGDRYATGDGSWSNGEQGKRQGTLMSARFFPGSGFTFFESRRNILVSADLELMLWLGGGNAQIGGATVQAVKYCDPCERPNKLSGNSRSFREAFSDDRGGIIIRIVKDGLIKVGDAVVPPSRKR